MFARLYWLLPLFSALVWLGTLLGLFLNWVVIGEPILPSMNPGQTIAYISDTGAFRLKPLFIAGGATTVVCLDLSLCADRWLRHTGRLAPNTSWFQKVLSGLAILASIVGAAGLILLSVFDTYRHPTLHDRFLAMFIIGYVVSAIFVCWEFQRLGMKHRQHAVLRASFWIKLAFIVVEIALAIAFGVLETSSSDAHINTAAILEWVVAIVFVFYVLSYVVDLIPAVRHHHRMSHPARAEMGMTTNGSSGYTNGANGYMDGTSGYPNGYMNGDSHPQQSRNF